MHWTLFKGIYPPGYVLPADTLPQSGWRGPSGEANWGTRHGPRAVVHWMSGKPVGADEIRLPTGRKRGRARWAVGTTDVWLRPLNDERRAFDRDAPRIPIRWQRGRLEITNREVTFVDIAPPPASDFSNEAHAPALKRDLYGHPEVHRIASELEGAVALRVLLQAPFVRAADGVEQVFSSGDDCAYFVAQVRGLNETTSDLAYADPSAFDMKRSDTLNDQLLDILANMGWLPKPIDPELLSELNEMRAQVEKLAAGPVTERAEDAKAWLRLLRMGVTYRCT